MTYRPRKRWGAALAAVLLLAACGSDDEEGANDDATPDTETTAEPNDAEPPAEEAPGDDGTEEGAVTPPPDEEGIDEGDDGDTIVIDDFDDIPDECVDLMAEFLQAIEDDVSIVDWETATIADIEALGDTLDVPTADLDDRITETGCDRFEIGVDDGQGLEFAIRVAEREAPGAVGWLEFIASFATLGETVDDVAGMDDDTGGETGTAGPNGDLPTDCEGTKAYLLDRAAEYGTIDDMPVSDVMTLMTAVQNLTTQCTLAEAAAFSENPTIAAFLGG